MPGVIVRSFYRHGVLNNVTFHGQLSKVPFEVIDGREKDFHVKDKLLGHSNGVQVLSAAHMP